MKTKRLVKGKKIMNEQLMTGKLNGFVGERGRDKWGRGINWRN